MRMVKYQGTQCSETCCIILKQFPILVYSRTPCREFWSGLPRSHGLFWSWLFGRLDTMWAALHWAWQQEGRICWFPCKNPNFHTINKCGHHLSSLAPSVQVLLHQKIGRTKNWSSILFQHRSPRALGTVTLMLGCSSSLSAPGGNDERNERKVKQRLNSYSSVTKFNKPWND